MSRFQREYLQRYEYFAEHSYLMEINPIPSIRADIRRACGHEVHVQFMHRADEVEKEGIYVVKTGDAVTVFMYQHEDILNTKQPGEFYETFKEYRRVTGRTMPEPQWGYGYKTW